jgi:hypothetical protein
MCLSGCWGVRERIEEFSLQIVADKEIEVENALNYI